MLQGKAVSELIFRMSTEDREFNRSLDRASGKVKSFGDRARQAANVGFVALAAGVSAVIARTIQLAAPLERFSETTGLMAEDLSVFRLMAERTGTTLDSVVPALQRMNVEIGKSRDDTTAASQALEKFGINLSEIDDSVELFEALSAASETASDEIEFATAVSVAFGRGNADTLIPMLRQGADGFREFQAEAERLGLVISQETAVAANELTLRTQEMRQRMDGIILQTGPALLGQLLDLSDELMNTADSATQAEDSLSLLGIAADTVGKIIEGWTLLIGAVNVALDNLNGGLELVTSNANNLWQSLRAFTTGDFLGSLEGLGNIVRDSWNFNVGVAGDLTERWTRLTANGSRRVREEIGETGEEVEEMVFTIGEAYDVLREEITSRPITPTSSLVPPAEEIDRELQRLESQLESWRQASLTNQERFENAFLDLSEMRERGLIDDSQFNELSAALSDRFDPYGFKQADEDARAFQRSLDEMALEVNATYAGIDLSVQNHLNLLQELLDTGRISWEAYEEAVREVLPAVEELKEEVESINEPIEMLETGVRKLGETIVDFLVDPMNQSFSEMASNFIREINRMVIETAVQRAIIAAVGGSGLNLPGFAEGGLVQGPGTSTSDSILARVSKDEFIMPAKRVNQFGRGFFEMLRAGKLPSFANGGSVNPSPNRGNPQQGGVDVYMVANIREMMKGYLSSGEGKRMMALEIQNNLKSFKTVR